MKNNMLQKTCVAAVIAALYTVLTVVIPAISYGPVQFRLSEILTILPLFSPAAIPGLTLGCFLSNLFGLTMGANVAGAWDLLFGTFATLIASVLSYKLRDIHFFKFPVLSFLSPVLLNAVIVGGELAITMFSGKPMWFFICMGEVGLSELFSVGIGGTFLYLALKKSNASQTIFHS